MVVSHNYRCSAVYECAEAAEYTDDEMNALMEEMISYAKANQFIHTGIPTAGDYAKWNYVTISTGAYCERSSVPRITVYTGMSYFITEDVEKELTAKLEEVMSSLDLDTKTEYVKIKAIYDYITSHVTYDWYHFAKRYDLKFTAYAALVNGTATVTVTGKGNCSGTVSRDFEIGKGEPTLTFAKESVTKSFLDEAFVNELTKTTDGRVTFKSSDTGVATVDSASGAVTIRGAGTAAITVSATAGINYMAGSANYTLTVEPISIEEASVSGVSLSYGYSGKAYTPVTTVTLNGITLAEGTDYTAAYENNIEPGTATITITGIGNYTGTRFKTFKIVDCVSELESGKTYQFIPKNNSSTAVCSFAGRMVNNTKVYITDRSASEAMKFKAVRNSDGTWKFINAKCELAFAVQQNSSEAGKSLVLYDQTTRKAQNWKLVKKFDNSFAVVNAVSGLYVAMSDDSAVKGTTLSMEENSGRGQQRFYIVETSAVDAPFDGTYGVKASKNKAYGLNIASASKTDGENVNLYKYSNTNAKKFNVIYSGGGYYRFVNVNSGLVLSVKGNTKTNGANVIQSKWAGQSGQRWKITGNSDGTVTLTNALGTVLHLSNNKTADGTNVVARNAAATGAQKWYMENVFSPSI